MGSIAVELNKTKVMVLDFQDNCQILLTFAPEVLPISQGAFVEIILQSDTRRRFPPPFPIANQGFFARRIQVGIPSPAEMCATVVAVVITKSQLAMIAVYSAKSSDLSESEILVISV